MWPRDHCHTLSVEGALPFRISKSYFIPLLNVSLTGSFVGFFTVNVSLIGSFTPYVFLSVVTLTDIGVAATVGPLLGDGPGTGCERTASAAAQTSAALKTIFIVTMTSVLLVRDV